MASKQSVLVLYNTLFQILGRSIVLILSIVTLTVIAHALTPDIYGEYTIILTLIAFATSFADFGISQISVREMSQRPAEAEVLVWETTIIRIIFAVLASIVSVAIIYFTNYDMNVKLGFALVLVSVLLISLQSGFQAAIQYKLKIYHLTIAEVLSKVVSSVFLVVVLTILIDNAASQELRLMIVIITIIVGAAISSLYTIIVGIRMQKLKVSWSFSRYKLLIIESIPIWFVGILSLVHYRVDLILLSIMKTSYEVGVYGLSYRLLDIILLLPGLFMASVFPILSASLVFQSNRSARIIQKSYDFLIILALPLAFGVLYSAPSIINLIGGSQFIDSVGVLRILIIAVAASFANAALSSSIVAQRGQSHLLKLTIGATMANIILNLILIPYYSYYGSAIATAITEVAVCLTSLLIVWKVYGVVIGQRIFIKSLASSLLMIAVLYLANFNQLWLVVPLGAAVYFISLYLMGGLDKEVIRSLIDTARDSKLLQRQGV